MFTAIKGVVLVAWAFSGYAGTAVPTPVSNFSDIVSCEKAKEQLMKIPKKGGVELQAECLSGVVIAVVNQPDKKETKVIKDQIPSENENVPKLP